ncbi:MAG: hypothetical protein MRJ65_07350, partial [Candidatus Brocadiaceae bacterium]|nr:hypothetical protein [Candidatus Brocadiaceae bacterium]
MRNVTFYLSQETGRIFSCLFIVFFLIVLIKNDAHALVTPQISGGGYHSLALKSDGSVWSWGRNEFGQLGDGTKNDSAIPIQIHTLSDIIYIGRGWMHSLALKSDGSVWAWGRNNHGQLGDGTTIDSSVPFQLKNFDTVY